MRGNGRPLVLVHGWGGSTRSLKSLIKQFSKNYQVIALDLPGFGKSDLPNKDWGITEYSEIIRELVKRLGIEKVNYFGHSFGGSLGIFLATKYPKLINHLVLCDSSYKRTLKRTNTPIGIIFNNLPLPKKVKQIIKKIIYRIFFPNSDLPNFPDLEPNYKKIMTQDLTSELEKIKQPTMILWGEEDMQTPIALAQELKEKISNSKLKIFPNIGHNLPLKYSQLVFDEVNKFLC